MALFAMGTLQAQDLEQILKAHYKAVGQKNLVDVKTLETTGKIQQMGMEMPLRSISKRPDKTYIEIDVQGTMMKQAYDGKNGWMLAPWTGSDEPIDLQGPDLRSLKNSSDIDGPLWNYKEKGHELEFTGTEDMEGTQVYALRLTRKDGNIDYMYMDTESNLILRTVSRMFINGSETEVEAFMSNYQEVNGFLMPFTIEQKFSAQPEMSMIINIEEVKWNEEINDSLFLKPGSTE
jgi:outer membrane lipoprotein-sorting protein